MKAVAALVLMALAGQAAAGGRGLAQTGCSGSKAMAAPTAGAGVTTLAAAPAISLADAAKVAPKYNLSILVEAVKAAGLTSLLTNASTAVTVFAPTDEAFTELIGELKTTAADLLADKKLLTSVLSYHVVPVPALSTDLTDGQVLPTLLPKASLTVSVSPKGVKVSNAAAKGADAPPAAKVVVPNIKAGKSVIHVIDRVLLPEVPSTRQMAESP